MARRILLLGITGVDKKTACIRLDRYRRDPHLVTVDFEHEFIERAQGMPLASYLDTGVGQQRALWREAWRRCK